MARKLLLFSAVISAVEMRDILKCITVIFIVFTLSALLAHVLELPGKINLSKEEYTTVQSIYSGWAWLGIFELGATALMVGWVIAERKKNNIVAFLFIATALFLISNLLFFILTFPANRATANWTQLPPNWEALKFRWEFSHAIRAILHFSGFCLVIVALIKEKNSFKLRR